MINNFIKFLILILVFSFFFIVSNYYFSEKNINLVKNNRNNLEDIVLNNSSNLPVLPNDTNNVIEFNSGFEDTSQQNFKRSFWELFN